MTMQWWQKLLFVTPMVLAALGVLYRHTLYWHLPVAPDQPYGIGDILDLGMALVVLGAAATTGLGALLTFVVPKWRSFRHGLLLVAAAVISVAAYRLLR